MRYFHHRILHMLYLSPQDVLSWRWVLPDGTSTHVRHVHLYTRTAPDQGCPIEECGVVPVAAAMFEGYLEELTFQQAYRLDPRLVDVVTRLQHYPGVATLLRWVSHASSLLLVACARSQEEILFDVYLMVPSETDQQRAQRLWLNPLLTGMLPCTEVNGKCYVVIPCADNPHLASLMLALALERCLWGEPAARVCHVSLAHAEGDEPMEA